jgi:hypothetical protein
MKNILTIILSFFTLISDAQKITKPDFIIGKGQLPTVSKDRNNKIHIVYGSVDSILYAYSADNANSFSTPELVVVLQHVYTFATRGPQIAATKNGIIISAATSTGNIHSFYKTNGSNNWVKGKRVNDVNNSAKEGLTGLSADGDNVVAVWLDLRVTKRNKIYSARSTDGGKTWAKNTLVYSSPDTTVCECCKPSVIIKEDKVYVMFRNWLHGNRDLYITQSGDRGTTFKPAQKLGNGNWKLNGCPMDGGGIAINQQGEVQTVWQRKGKIFAAIPGKVETEIGEGRSCTMETINNKNVYAWIEKGEVVFSKSQGQKKILGKGNQPVLQALNNEHVLCVWENDKQIHTMVLEL